MNLISVAASADTGRTTISVVGAAAMRAASVVAARCSVNVHRSRGLLPMGDKPRSERRQRTEIVAVRFTPDERRRLAAAAKRFDYSVSELLRTKLPELIEFGGWK